MKDNSYAFIIDCSLDKKDNIIIYELQPLIDSGLGNKKGAQRNAFQKAFPNKSISIEYFGVNIKNNNSSIFVKKCEDVKDEEFNQEYAYKFTPSRYESSQLGSKINQRLYLPHEVSPKHLVLDLSLDSDELTNRVIQYFKDKNIERIVLKHPDLAVGEGNIFIDDSTNKESIKDGIELLKKTYRTRSGFLKYLLAEEQKIFPRISRKTEEKKDGYLTFRIVGIATKEGGLGYFIATKSLSEEINSHKRKRMKCYFGEGHQVIDDDSANNKWDSTYVGPKDKYFNIGGNKILIEESIMQKVFKVAYHLYHDIKSHSKIEFQEHIAKCVKAYNNKENYSPFMDHEFEKLELVEKNDLAALLLINEAHYLPLRNKVKNEINYELVNLRDGYNKYIECGGKIDSIVSSSSHIGNFYCGGTMICEYSSDFILKDLLYVIEIQNAFDILELLVTNHSLEIEALLNTAAKKGHLNIVKYLTENKNTDRNFKVDGALILAVEERHLETVKYLVENKDINQNLKIDLALILAAERGYLDIVRYLVDNKDINQNLEIDSALIVAAERGRLDIVKYLIEEHGYKPKDINQLIDKTVYSVYSNINVMRYLIDERKCIQLDEYPYTKLLSKGTLYSFDKTKYFIQEKGYDINDQNKDGNTVLHNAVNHFNYDGDEYISIIKFLVNYPGVDLNRKNNAGQTPLMYSDCYGAPQIKKIILDAQKTPNFVLDNLEKTSPMAAQNTAEKGR